MMSLNRLAEGCVIPACPLALHQDGKWSERHQRALIRYYVESGAGGLAVGVHSTQFAIRAPEHRLFEPLLRMASTAVDEASQGKSPFVKIAGICGDTRQATSEAEIAVDCGYHAGLLSTTAIKEQDDTRILEHCRTVAETIPIIGFYLQPAVGGRNFSEGFWRDFATIENVVAIKIAPFDRYKTLDVIRAVIKADRNDIALYTGNDDNIVVDLLSRYEVDGQRRFIVGGLLGQWGVWTRKAVSMFEAIRSEREKEHLGAHWLTLAAKVTDANAAIFDAANGFAGCIPGIMEVLRRQGLVPSVRCLDPNEVMSPGQKKAIDRVCRDYPELTDDNWVSERLQNWLA